MTRGILHLSMPTRGVLIAAMAVGLLAVGAAQAGVTPGSLVEPATRPFYWSAPQPALTATPQVVIDLAQVAPGRWARQQQAPIAAERVAEVWTFDIRDLTDLPVSETDPLAPAPDGPLEAMVSQARHSESLAGAGDDEIGNPLVDFSQLSMAPTGFVVVRSGLPTGSAMAWPHTVDTALSYVRPHRNLQIVMNFHGGDGRSDTLSGNAVASDAQLVENMNVEVDTRSLSTRSASFGEMTPANEQSKPHAGRVVTLGFDLGLLPAVLADVGMCATVTVGESTNPGMFVSVATNVEVPSDQPDGTFEPAGEQAFTDIISGGIAAGGVSFAGGFASDGTLPIEVIEEDDPDPIPIIPDDPIPEPAALVVISTGLALLAARRRKARGKVDAD